MITTPRLSLFYEWITYLAVLTGILALAVMGCGGAPLEDDPTVGMWSEAGVAPPAFVFMSERTGQGDLYVMDISGARMRQLTFAPEPDFAPRWASETELLYFLSERRPDPGFYRMSFERDTAVFVAANPVGRNAPVPSPDGEWIAYAAGRNGNQDIYVSRLDGTGERRITSHESDDGQPAWSPDGRTLAFTSFRDRNSEIYTIDVWGGTPRNITRNRSNDTNPSWSPDGTQILFDSTRPPGGNPDIFVSDRLGTTVRNLTNHGNVDLIASWSPDGGWITFQSSRDGDWEVYVMRPDGSGQRRLTHSRGFDGDARWVPADKVRW